MSGKIREIITVDPEKCTACHRCISVCPAKMCNDASGDYIKVNSELCIGCGRCISACHFGARQGLDDFDSWMNDLKAGVKMIAIVAPSSVVSFRGRILEAEAEKETNIRRAEGIRQAKVLEATGEAEAIERIAQAKAKDLELQYAALKNAGLDDRMVAVKSLETLEKASQGAANKVFIPFDTSKTLGAIVSMKEVFKD